MPAEHPQPDFRNMTLQYGIVLVALYRSRDAPRWLGDLARAIGNDTGTVGAIVRRLEASGYVGSWLEEPEKGDTSRKFIELTDVGVSAVREAVRRFGIRLGDLDGLPIVESSGSEADVARELGILLGLVRDQAGWSSTAVAALVGHGQPWWSQHENGTIRQPNVHKLRVIMRALGAPGDTIARVVELAETLNRLWTERTGRAR